LTEIHVIKHILQQQNRGCTVMTHYSPEGKQFIHDVADIIIIIIRHAPSVRSPLAANSPHIGLSRAISIASSKVRLCRDRSFFRVASSRQYWTKYIRETFSNYQCNIWRNGVDHQERSLPDSNCGSPSESDQLRNQIKIHWQLSERSCKQGKKASTEAKM